MLKKILFASFSTLPKMTVELPAQSLSTAPSTINRAAGAACSSKALHYLRHTSFAAAEGIPDDAIKPPCEFKDHLGLRMLSASSKQPADAVLHLDDAGLSSTITSTPVLLVLFYTPWCSACGAVKPQFAAAAAKLLEEGSARLAAVDVGAHQGVAQKYGLEFVPAIILFVNGSRKSDHNKLRAQDEFVDLMKTVTKKHNPP